MALELSSNFWTSVAVAVAAPVIGFLAAVWKLKREGIGLQQLEEIKDRASFRQHLLDRIALVEGREKEILARSENHARLQQQEINTLHGRIEELEKELNIARHERLSLMEDLRRSTALSERAMVKADKAQNQAEASEARRLHKKVRKRTTEDKK